MKNTANFEQIRSRTALCHGSRTVLVFECERPAGDTPMARHAQALAAALQAHAAREYVPRAAAELEKLAMRGQGYAFCRHRVQFCARVMPARTGVYLALSLRYFVGEQCRLAQSVRQHWNAGGTYRLL